jgi:(1->4)-alpha-D-glucan 1-alpha-D-glucosylmutase
MTRAAGSGRTVPVRVEKILQPQETLPEDWPTAGTTGYEFLRVLAGLFVDRDGFARLQDHAASRLGLEVDFDAIVHSAKREAVVNLLGAELGRQVGLARSAPGDAPPAGDGPVRDAIVELTAALPVYRTYLDGSTPSSQDEASLETAFRRAGAALGDGHPGLDRVRSLLAPDASGAEAFRVAWQQLTGPAMAKGLEDTALYRHVVLTSLNEVGGEPVLPEDPLASWHEFQRARAQRTPGALSATSTHDTKRGEDARARIGVLSEFADQWTAALDRWLAWHGTARTRTAAGWSPTPREEVLFYQSLLAIWPPEVPADEDLADRLGDYMVKAAREARRETSWHDQDEQHEAALLDFTDMILLEAEGDRFRADVIDLRRKVAFFGAVSGLSQCVLRCTAPGVPDCYGGAELWDLTLVDPDNRRPVDFDLRRRLIGTLHHDRGGEGHRLRSELLVRWSDGRLKMWTIAEALRLRRERSALFELGEYVPLAVEGTHAGRVVADARRRGDAWAIVVVPRLVARLAPVGRWPVGRSAWQDTRVMLPPHAPARLTEWFTGTTLVPSGGALALADALAGFPVAVLLDGSG